MPIKRYILPLLVAAIACYPIYGVLLLAVDTACGTRQLLQWATFESKHMLLQREMADVLASLIVTLPTVLITAFTALLCWRKGGIKPFAVTLTVIAVIPALAFIAIGFTTAQATLFATAILLSAIVAALCSWIFDHAKH